MKKRLLQPWQTICVLTTVAVLAACEPKVTATSAAASGQPAASAVAQGPAAPALPQQPPALAPDLQSLDSYVGSYPSEGQINFLEQGALAQRLKALLGGQYRHFLANMRTVGPLQANAAGHWYITGNRPHEGGMEAAAVVIDPQRNTLRVWMLHEGQQTEYQDPAAPTIPWPDDVVTMQRNAQRHTKVAPSAASGG